MLKEENTLTGVERTRQLAKDAADLRHKKAETERLQIEIKKRQDISDAQMDAQSNFTKKWLPEINRCAASQITKPGTEEKEIYISEDHKYRSSDFANAYTEELVVLFRKEGYRVTKVTTYSFVVSWKISWYTHLKTYLKNIFTKKNITPEKEKKY